MFPKKGPDGGGDRFSEPLETGEEEEKWLKDKRRRKELKEKKQKDTSKTIPSSSAQAPQYMERSMQGPGPSGEPPITLPQTEFSKRVEKKGTQEGERYREMQKPFEEQFPQPPWKNVPEKSAKHKERREQKQKDTSKTIPSSSAQAPQYMERSMQGPGPSGEPPITLPQTEFSKRVEKKGTQEGERYQEMQKPFEKQFPQPPWKNVPEKSAKHKERREQKQKDTSKTIPSSSAQAPQYMERSMQGPGPSGELPITLPQTEFSKRVEKKGTQEGEKYQEMQKPFEEQFPQPPWKNVPEKSAKHKERREQKQKDTSKTIPSSSAQAPQYMERSMQGPGPSGELPITLPQTEFSKRVEKKGTQEGERYQEMQKPFEEYFPIPQRITASKKPGRSIVVATNFFSLVIKNPDITVHHYDVVIEPNKPKYLLRNIWNKFVSLKFPGRLLAFDGKNAYSKGPLMNGMTASATVTVLNPDTNREREHNVSIQEVRRISFSCFKDYRERIMRSQSMKTLPEAEMAVLDIILRNWACDHFVRCSRVFFSPASSRPIIHELSKKLCLRIGYFQSVFLGFKPYLNFDIAHKAFYKDCSMLDVFDCFKNTYTGGVDLEQLNHFVRTVKVEYQLPNDPSTRKVYRVNKLVANASQQTFKKEDGTVISVARYYEIEKKYRIRHCEIPLLWVGPTQKSIYLPMELCRIAPDQVFRGLLDSFETRKFVEKATSNARERRKYVENSFQNVDINRHPLMKEFGIEISNEMEKVPARVLFPPVLKTSRNVRVENGTWRTQDFFYPVTLTKWCILNLDKNLQKQNLMTFQNMIKNKGIDFNMKIGDPVKVPINMEPTFQGIKKVFSQLKDMEMVFVIISGAKGVYERVKAICETQEGVLTQCVKSRTVMMDPNRLQTTVQNILLKVNAKLGGINHSLDSSSLPECLKGYVMIVGADVTHPSPGLNIPSVAAVSYSCDPSAFRYGIATRVQPKGEMIQDLEEIISMQLKSFHKERGKYPEKIIFFRDGVSEGELLKVFKNEIFALRKACNANNCDPKLTFVVVQKRHHTRLYPTSTADEQGKNFNVPVGTCVDSDIVHPKDLDFYLVSHASLLGTARPTRYRRIYDDNKLTDDDVETLAYYLCHLFARCNRAVSYPSPTYNAHLAAARVRAHLVGLNLMSGGDIEDIKRKLPDKISNNYPMFFV